MGLRNLCGTGQSKGQHTCCTFIAEMIVHLYELSLHGKAGSQVDRVRAWRHELQLALSTSIACYRMNKLTSCHNISKWISGDLDSKCISSDFPVLNMATVLTMWCGHKWSWWKQTKTHRSVCQSSPQKLLQLYEYTISITQKQPLNASTGMSHSKMGLGMRSDFFLHSSSEAPYLCLMWAVYRKRDFNG